MLLFSLSLSLSVSTLCPTYSHPHPHTICDSHNGVLAVGSSWLSVPEVAFLSLPLALLWPSVSIHTVECVAVTQATVVAIVAGDLCNYIE